MPSHYAHYYFGKEVIRVMPGDAKDIINSNATSIDAYMTGLHGPDFLAFYRPWHSNRLSREGRQIHHSAGRDFFERATGILRKNPSPETYSYVLGCVTHFILDAACHPLISEFMKETGQTHAKIERDFDSYILGICRKSPRKVNLDRVFPHSKKIDELISGFYESTNRRNTQEALETMNRVLTLFSRPNTATRNATYRILSAVPSRAIQSRRDMIYRDGDERRTSVSSVKLFDTLNKSVMPASAEMDSFMNHVLLDTPLDETFDLNYLGVLPE
nr:zinc dependent phospholipase C family protein [uncultured Mogibacterium sp.]